MKRVSDEEVMHVLRDVVRERPDFVYEPPRTNDSCRYVHREGDVPVPGCLVGTAFFRLGASLEVLERVDNGVGEVPGSIREVAKLAGLKISEEAGYALKHAQVSQDCGNTWRHALTRAEEVFHGD